jgi:hypothetical protein
LRTLTNLDEFIERTNKILSFGPAQTRDITSLNNWVENTGCLAREETAYLTHYKELVSLAPAGDSTMMQFETWVEDKVIRFWPKFDKVRASLRHQLGLTSEQSCNSNISKDPNVYIYSGGLIQHIARALLLLLITFLLLGPVVICNIVSTTAGRIIVVTAFTIFFLVIVCGLTKSNTLNLILTGAT